MSYEVTGDGIIHCCPKPENYEIIVSLCGFNMRATNDFAYPIKFSTLGLSHVRCEVCESHPDLPLALLGDVP